MNKIRIADIKYNDTVNGEGLCVSVWFQGCDIRCPGCHNAHIWDENGGTKIEDTELHNIVIEALHKNNIMRNLSLLGGEPLSHNNIRHTLKLIDKIQATYPDIKIFLWTGYNFEYSHFFPFFLPERVDLAVGREIMTKVDYIISGPFIQEQKDLTLWLRGSRNQKVWKNLKNEKKYVIIDKNNKGEIVECQKKQ